MNEKTVAINQKLREKLALEYDAFAEELRGKSSKEILDVSYENVFKKDIMFFFRFIFLAKMLK